MEKQNGNGGGFLTGLLIGAAVGSLVSSKKGRQILKDLADYGLEYVGKTVNLDDIETILNEEEEQMSPYAKASEDKMNGEVQEEAPIEKEEPKRRRLFRGIRKK